MHETVFPDGRLATLDLHDGSYKKEIGRRFSAITPFGKVVVPAGYISDGASIPRVAWSIIGGPWGPYAPAAVIHDWLYSEHAKGVHAFTRKQADISFVALMTYLGIGTVKRITMYRAVRLGGWVGWNRHGRQ